MKMLLNLSMVLATTVLATLAQATPLVGDYSNFKLTINAEGQTLVGTYEMALVAKTANGFKMTRTTKFDNQPAQHEEQDVNTEDLANDEFITAVLESCAEQGGVSEVVTVAAGTFNTCALPTETGKVWVTHAPFGIVKVQETTPEGYLVNLELQSFANGKAK